MSSNQKLQSVENLIQIEQKKTNNINTIRIIIGSFSSNLEPNEINYLYDKYLNTSTINTIQQQESKKTISVEITDNGNINEDEDEPYSPFKKRRIHY